MIIKHSATLLFLILTGFGQLLAAEPVAVIVNSNNTEVINAETIKAIYSDKKSFWSNGEKILLFELPVKSRSREKFSQEILRKSAVLSQSDWFNRYVKNTIRNDVKLKPYKLVVRFVSHKESAIGYVPISAVNNITNVKVVMVID